ncbi:MAG: hypothetical protein GC171_02075 [Terrimonas sp.]|nr:hypothetical protein [Terrimonas sp.]
MKKILISSLFITILSCNNRADNKPSISDDLPVPDSVSSNRPPFIQPNTNAFNNRPDINEEREKERRAILYMSIDSTYFAINAIEDIKNDLVQVSSINLSVPERNLKSKALLKMNIIQNSLARQVDSTLLVNLKKHSNELAGINKSITGDIVHLKNLSLQLNRLTAIMGRLTDVLTMCVSRGLIKPPTPISKSPEEIKETLN